MAQQSKPIWKSYTFWWNVASGLIVLFQNLNGQYQLVSNEHMALVNVLGNIALRFKTDTAVTLNG